MTNLVIVSNGEEFLRINPNDVADALADGFYRPLQRGLTIVGNNEHLFEIPLSDVNAAKSNGYVDLLERERMASAQVATAPQPVMHRAAVAASHATPAQGNQVQGHQIPQGQANDQWLLMDGLTQAEQEEAEAQLEREQELEEADGIAWYRVWLSQWFAARRIILQRQLGSHGISIVIHLAIVLLLASLVMVNDNEPKGLMLSASPAQPESVQDVIIESEPLEITDPTEVEETDAPPETSEVEVEMTPAVTAPNFMAAVSGDAVKAPAKPAKETGKGKTLPTKQSSVFGTQETANDYVFVIDNSNSMSQGRFETALYELMVAVNGLNKKQRFYVIFYSDTAYGMMYPNPVTQMVYATDRNKQQMFQWLNTVPLCLKTNGKEAIQAAFSMKPDVIYVLGDGAFTDGASKYFATVAKSKTILHTRGMQVNASLAKSFAQLAKAHGGNYKDVGVNARAAIMAKQNPRPRNKFRNGVWGITLPIMKK